MSIEQIIKEYEEQKATFSILESRIITLINDLSKEHNISLHDVRARVKEKDSLRKKIEKKKDKYNKLNDITDVVGLRIITYFNDDVDKLASIIEKEFIMDKSNSVDKRKKDPDRFGYASLHYIVTLDENRLKLVEYKHFSGIKFEIQIRSILQHAWAEIEHDLGYKSKNEIPEEIRRDFSRVAGLLELADMEFLRIKEYLSKYAEEVESKIENNSLEIKIDKVSLNEYISRSKIIEEINNKLKVKFNIHILKFMESNYELDINKLKRFKITEISTLDNLLIENKDKIVKFFEEWNKNDSRDDENGIYKISFGYDISLFYLYYVLVYENYSESYIREYLKLSLIDKKEHDGVVEQFNEMKMRNLIL